MPSPTIIPRFSQSGKTMAEYNTGAHFISRKRRGGGGRKAFGVIVTVLLILTAAICLLVVLLPKSTERDASVSVAFGGKKFYFLATSESDDRASALTAAQNTAARGGAGYVYNDGKYKTIAAAYKNKADADALAGVNDGAFCAEYSVPACNLSGGDLKAARYLVGEWFDSLYNAASELERSNITEAQAERAAKTACVRLSRLADGAKSVSIRRAIEKSADYSPPSGITVKSYIRYVSVAAVVALGESL